MRRTDLKKGFIGTVQRKVAVSAVGPSAVRGQGKGVLRAAQEFLASIPLRRIPKASERRFRRWLDRQTEALLDEFPGRARRWGAGRKVLNLFLRDALYNQYLNRHFKVFRIEPWLEVALDSLVARGLKRASGRGALPRWPGLKHLSPDVSDLFQDFALRHARSLGIARVHLDMYLWLANR